MAAGSSVVNSNVHPLARLVIERSDTPACRSASHTVPPNRPSHPSVTRFLPIRTGYGAICPFDRVCPAGRCEAGFFFTDSVGCEVAGAVPWSGPAAPLRGADPAVGPVSRGTSASFRRRSQRAARPLTEPETTAPLVARSCGAQRVTGLKWAPVAGIARSGAESARDGGPGTATWGNA